MGTEMNELRITEQSSVSTYNTFSNGGKWVILDSIAYKKHHGNRDHCQNENSDSRRNENHDYHRIENRDHPRIENREYLCETERGSQASIRKFVV